jgi:lipoprotein-releasing system permease protein
LNLPFHIARRYLFAKKSHNAINIISYISVGGVAFGTMALIVVLSVFNGFDNLVRSLLNSFNPDLIITVREGKTFVPDAEKLSLLEQTPGVIDFAQVVEDRALVRYMEKQTIATVKGVSENFNMISGVDSMVREGTFLLKKGNNYFSVIGQGIAFFLGVDVNIDLHYRRELALYVPNRKSTGFTNPERDITRKYVTPAGIFAIEQDFDSKYILVPIEFARELFGFTKEVTAIEVKTDPRAGSSVQKMTEEIFGPDYEVKNRFQQNELFYKTMKGEKWAIFLILVFILAILSFNIIGSLTMLILEKKKDVSILISMGADMKLVKKIFQLEGWLITITGTVIGLVTGLLITFLQIRFKLIKLQGSGSFVIDAYPVDVRFLDVMVIFAAVIVLGYFAAWYPIRFVMKRLSDERPK